MNSVQVDDKQKELSQNSQRESLDSFDFDHWAGAVKRQMIASLRKRGDAPSSQLRSDRTSD